MSLIKWGPFDEIDNVFESFPSLLKQGFDLGVDISEKDDNIIAEMNLPGVDPDKIEISVEDNYLRVSGTREESKEEKRKHYYSKEIRRGSFERTISLPQAVQKDKVVAESKNGTLTITMPRLNPETSEKVKVQVKKQ